MEVKSDVAAVRDILTKNANPDGSVGSGRGDRPDESGVEAVTNNEVAAAAAALNQNSPAGDEGNENAGADDGAGSLTDEQIAALNAKLDAGEELTEEEQAMVESAAQGDQGGSGDDVVLTPQELAEAIGWEAKDVYEGIMIPMDDGQDPVPLGELKNELQNSRRTVQELQEKVEQGTEGAQQQNEMAQMSQGMMQLAAYMQQLNQIEQGTNWQELEEDDASAAVLKRQKLWQAKQQTVQRMQQLQQKEAGLREQRVGQEREKMLGLIPNWKDDKARVEDQGAIRSHLKDKFGFNDVEVNRIQDARTMAVLQDYVSVRKELAELKEAASGAVKRVRQAPRVMRDSGGRFMSQQQGVSEDAAINKLTAKAKRTGNKNDALAAAKALLTKSQKGIPRSVDGRQPRRRVQGRSGQRA